MNISTVEIEKNHTDDNADDLFVSNHTISMRQALEYCREMETTAKPIDPAFKLCHSAIFTARNLEMIRQEAAISVSEKSHINILERPIQDFTKEYEIPNRPCLVRNVEIASTDSVVSTQWTTPGVFHDWMRSVIGEDTCVPVRYQPSNYNEKDYSLDAQGRATECPIQNMIVSDWLHMISETNKNNACDYYLKDWHLIQRLLNEQRQQQQKDQKQGTAFCLYETPLWFGYDLLNAFLTRFTDGDYRFVYHGPQNSSTTLHSDVLNSFSWSYNVYGIKEWIFHVPTSVAQCNESLIVIQQKAHEIMFVPATWRHSVRNLEETLSINHNWITTANLDLTWDCLCLEMLDIEQELEAWDTPSKTSMEYWEVRENMLRGCSGLDVTEYCLLMLVRGFQILYEIQTSENQGNKTIDESVPWMASFDLVRLSDSLEAVINDKSIHLEVRLHATLSSEPLATECIEMIGRFIKQVQNMLGASKAG